MQREASNRVRPKAIGAADTLLGWREFGVGAAASDISAEPALWGDAVLSRRDIPASYHISVVIDDAAQGITDVVRGSDLDWTVVRPSGLFDLSEPSDYVAGEIDPIGAFTARIDLARYLLVLAADGHGAGKTVVVSTTEHTPSLWQMIVREAGAKPAVGTP